MFSNALVYTVSCLARALKDGSLWYLVKWRELGYDQATWEIEGEDIPDFQRQIDNFFDLRCVPMSRC